MKLPLHSPDAKSFAPDDSEANRLGEISHQTGGSVVDPNLHGSAFIWMSWICIHLVVPGFQICIGNADQDPDQYWECRSGSRSRSMEIGQNLHINQVSCL